MSPQSIPGPRIYNLFPLLAGKMNEWDPHLERAREMGFNWIFLNPFHEPGFSGSLYSIKDFYSFHPLLLDPNGGPPLEQLERAVGKAHRLGMQVMMDLVLNHTAVDSPLVQQHPDWYQRGSQGEVLHPGAYHDGQWVGWGDLAAMDNAGSRDRENLWRYWRELAHHYAGRGFDGFRCDAAYQVPPELWSFLIESVRKQYPDCRFFAETLGCTIDQCLRLVEAGFDYIFNSSKWWDFSAPWCLEQYRQSAPRVGSVSFPESHDTDRLAAELDGDREAVRQRYFFAALFSTGVMIPIGFEYGFRRRLHVVETRPQDWEMPSWDDTGFIRGVNGLKQRSRIWNEEGPAESLPVSNPAVLALHKTTRDGRERSLLLFNKDRRQPQRCALPDLRNLLGNSPSELSPEMIFRPFSGAKESTLHPAGFQVFLGAPPGSP